MIDVERPPEIPGVYWFGAPCPRCDGTWWIGVSNDAATVRLVDDVGHLTSDGFDVVDALRENHGICSDCRDET